MNRRQLITAAAPSLALLLSQNRVALARVQTLATPEASDRSRPDLELEDYSREEAVYLGALTTWLELLETSIDGLYEGLEALEEDPESIGAKAQMLMPLGVWQHLALDVQQFDGPEVFALVQRYATTTFNHLGSAADIISAGLVSDSPTAVTLGTEHITLASEELGKLMAALPFDRPRRADFFS